MAIDSSYLEELRRRARESRIYRKYQMTGLEIAGILQDDKHKALYIKLAKEGNAEKILRLAKEVAERRNVKNKGAYFMKILQSEKLLGRRSSKQRNRKRN